MKVSITLPIQASTSKCRLPMLARPNLKAGSVRAVTTSNEHIRRVVAKSHRGTDAENMLHSITENFDPLRDGPLRYLGYSNECGEAFSPFIPPAVVALSYAIAIAYVLIDTYDKREKTIAETRKQFSGCDDASLTREQEEIVRLRATEKAVDTILWQTLACMLAPGVIVHKLVHWTSDLLTLDGHGPLAALLEGGALESLRGQSGWFSFVLDIFPTAVGLAVIPVICHPIDHGVDRLLDSTVRPVLKSYTVAQEARLLPSKAN